jgi:hypothetical protein
LASWLSAEECVMIYVVVLLFGVIMGFLIREGVLMIEESYDEEEAR